MINFVESSIEILNAPEPDHVYNILGTAAANCYQSEPKDKGRLVEKIVNNGHHSVLEHMQVTFKVTCDRAVSHEWVRHRVGTAYSQESQRYCAYKEDLEVIIPHWAMDNLDAYMIWMSSMHEAHERYQSLLKAGLKPEDARGVLPNACATKIVVSMNFRALIHFINLRGSMRAHPDIRFFANELQEWFGNRYPKIIKKKEEN